MTDRVYPRHSTDKQTDSRQRHALAALLAAGAPVYEDPATSSRMLSPRRDGFTALLHEAAVGDTIRIADAARLFRSVADIIALRPVLIRRGPHLRVESGLLSGIDLAAGDPGTKMMVSVLAAVLEFQRDMISENTREGVTAAAASGKTLGRPTALSADKAIQMVAAYRDGEAVKALARTNRVAPRTIRRVLDAAAARALPDQDADTTPGNDQGRQTATERQSDIVLDIPGLLAEHLRAAGNEEVRQALLAGQTVRRGQGHSLRLSAAVDLHRAALAQSAALATAGPAERKAYHVYAARIAAAEVKVHSPRSYWSGIFDRTSADTTGTPFNPTLTAARQPNPAPPTNTRSASGRTWPPPPSPARPGAHPLDRVDGRARRAARRRRTPGPRPAARPGPRKSHPRPTIKVSLTEKTFGESLEPCKK